jgi:hypothetical protein
MRTKVISHRTVNYAMAEEVALHLMHSRLKALWMYPLDAKLPNGNWVVFIIPDEAAQA